MWFGTWVTPAVDLVQCFMVVVKASMALGGALRICCGRSAGAGALWRRLGLHTLLAELIEQGGMPLLQWLPWPDSGSFLRSEEMHQRGEIIE
jgi:hypothetical protein